MKISTIGHKDIIRIKKPIFICFNQAIFLATLNFLVYLLGISINIIFIPLTVILFVSVIMIDASALKYDGFVIPTASVQWLYSVYFRWYLYSTM